VIKKFTRFRSVWIKCFGLWLLKETDSEKAKFQVKDIKEELNSHEDLKAYFAKLMSKKMDYTKPLWEIHVKENYKDDTSVVFCVVHHLITDGMGMVSLITLLNYNHSADIITNYRKISLFFRYIYPLLWLPMGIFKYILLSFEWKRDSKIYPLMCSNNTQSNRKTFHETKQYHFDKLKKCYTKFDRMKLNDMLVGVISISVHSYLTELGLKDLSHMSITTPINMKSQAKDLDSVKLANDWAPCCMNVPLRPDIRYVMKKNRETYDVALTLSAVTCGALIVTALGLLPDGISRTCMSGNYKGFNGVISNTPGPINPIYICDRQVLEMG